MRKTVSSRRNSSAMASRKASRTVWVTVSPRGISPAGGGGAGAASAAGAAGIGASAAGAGGASGGDGAGAAWSISSIAEASSPSARITATGVLTATPSVPSGTRILPSTPSSTASSSMVALSVSISARTSPLSTVSPSFFSHFASVPSVMVGDSAGIRT